LIINGLLVANIVIDIYALLTDIYPLLTVIYALLIVINQSAGLKEIYAIFI